MANHGFHAIGAAALALLVAGCRLTGQQPGPKPASHGERTIAGLLASLCADDAKERDKAASALAERGPAALFQLCPFIQKHLDDPSEHAWRTACRVEEDIARRYQDDPRLDDYYASLKPVSLPVKAVTLPGGLKMEFLKVPTGVYVQGSYNPGPAVIRAKDMQCYYAPVRKVAISRPFWLARDEVRQEEWEAVMGFNRSRDQRPHLPVERVSWYEALEFCRKLADRNPGFEFSLPTEAQWEYACRAGGTSRHAFGNQAILRGDARFGYDAVWVQNRWGFRHMHDGVFEWCMDWYGDYTEAPATDPTGPEEGIYKAIRSNYTYCSAADVRCAHRSGFPPDIIRHGIGFRPMFVEVVEKK